MPRSALVADQSPYAARILRDLLVRAGIDRVETVLDGAEALGALSERRPGLLVLDWDLPVVGAREIIDMAHAREGQDPPMRILVTMPEPTRTGVEEARARGVDAIVVKPFSPGFVRRRLEQMLARGRVGPGIAHP